MNKECEIGMENQTVYYKYINDPNFDCGSFLDKIMDKNNLDYMSLNEFGGKLYIHEETRVYIDKLKIILFSKSDMEREMEVELRQDGEDDYCEYFYSKIKKGNNEIIFDFNDSMFELFKCKNLIIKFENSNKHNVKVYRIIVETRDNMLDLDEILRFVDIDVRDENKERKDMSARRKIISCVYMILKGDNSFQEELSSVNPKGAAEGEWVSAIRRAVVKELKQKE